jgi:hypothetical protein
LPGLEKGSHFGADSHNAGRSFDGVTVFPVLSAPDAANLTAGRSLRDIFHRFVCRDPIVAARGDVAVSTIPAWEAVTRGLSADGFPIWPVRYEDWDFLRQPDPVYWAGAEFRDRYRSLIDLFRSERRNAITGASCARARPSLSRILGSPNSGSAALGSTDVWKGWRGPASSRLNTATGRH